MITDAKKYLSEDEYNRFKEIIKEAKDRYNDYILYFSENNAEGKTNAKKLYQSLFVQWIILSAKATQQEYNDYFETADKLLKGCIEQINRIIDVITMETPPEQLYCSDDPSLYPCIKEDQFYYVSDLKEVLEAHMEEFRRDFEKCPEELAEINRALEKRLAKYPNQFIIKSNTQDLDIKSLETKLGKPIKRTKYGIMFKYKDFQRDEDFPFGLVYSYSKKSDSKKSDLPNVTTSILPRIICPLDKVNENIWCGNFQIGEAFMLNAVSERDAKKGKTADIIAMIDFEEMEKIFDFSRPLTVYDKRVWTVVANYAYAGQNIITPSQIYKTAFNERTKPNPTDKEKIVESLKLLIRVRLTLDNTTEAKLYGYDLIKGDYPLLSGSLVTAYVNGQLTESALQISEVPKLFQFALNRNHVATVTTRIYQSPVNSNETGLKISDYLLGRILRMNNPNSKSQNTIVLKTLYERCCTTNQMQKTNRMQKTRCKTRAIRVLEDFKKKDLIVGFTLDPDETKLIITPKLNNKT